jgi:hypothetical protein
VVTAGSSLAETGAISPLLGIWGPNVLVVTAAVYLVLTANGSPPFSRSKQRAVATRKVSP